MTNKNQTYTDSEINRIIDRGVMLDWIGILSTIKADPEGELSQRVLAVCDANPGYAGSSIIKQAVIRYRTPEADVAPEIMKGTLDSKPNSWFN